MTDDQFNFLSEVKALIEKGCEVNPEVLKQVNLILIDEALKQNMY